MLSIRKSQIEAMAAPMRESFEKQVVAHVHEFFPDACEQLGEDATTQAVQHGISQAESYGLRASGPMTQYINLMFSFGWHFDLEQSWAAAILRDTALDEATRIARLNTCAEAMIHEAQGITAPE